MGTSGSSPLDIIGSSESDRRIDCDSYDLPEPPSPDEVRVEWIGMDHRGGVARAHHTTDCQAPSGPVRCDCEHVLAMVGLEGRVEFARPPFCGRTCWSEWASRL